MGTAPSKRRGAQWSVALAAVLIAGAACGPPTVSLESRSHAYTAADYESVYRSWTRDATPFDFEGLSTVIRVTATFEASPFRWAYVVRYAEDFGLPTEARGALLEASLDDAKQHHRFFVTLAGNRTREVNLTHERTAWRVLLLDDRGNQTQPTEIQHIKRPTPAQRTYFPSVSRQRSAFQIAFPVRTEDGEATVPDDSLFTLLRFTGPLGQVDLKWVFPLNERGKGGLRERLDRGEAVL